MIDGRAYAAIWVPCREEKRKTVNPDGSVIVHDPPIVSLMSVLLIVRDDGQVFTDAAIDDSRRLSELGFEVRLPSPLPPGREWSGAGVKRYRAGERPKPDEVFARVVSVVNRFIDFQRSLASQEIMCEMVGCYVVATYFLEALNVFGYLFSSGEKGAGKSSVLQVVTEMAYLGQFIQAGSSYACLRDLADYGATLAFDDAEKLDPRSTDPDKRTLLLAGSRRGAAIAVKELVGEKWETRFVNTFCPRLFSAIHLPDDVLGSRCILTPLVRSGDAHRAKANPEDAADWPTDRRQLVDDLWAMGLTHLALIPTYDRMGAELSELCGRPLDPWRPILAVAAWLEDKHGVNELFGRMKKLSEDYQNQRADLENADRTRVLFRALLQISSAWGNAEQRALQTKEIADVMNRLANEEDLTEPDKPFTTARKAGWQLKRLGYHRPDGRSDRGKLWEMTREEIVKMATTYGVSAVPDTTS